MRAVRSSLLNIGLDLLLIVPLNMGVAGAAWATVLSQLLSAVLCTIVGLRKFPVLRSGIGCLGDWKRAAMRHLRIGFLMGFQMSVMCIGQLAMQVGVNALGAVAIAGYTAATKADQVSVLINNAFGIAVSSYVAQNFGARRTDRIRDGVKAGLIQITTVNVFLCALLLLARNAIVSLFMDAPTPEIISYASEYFVAIAPFYPLLGLLLVFRSAVQSMGNSTAPFAACMVELVMRILATAFLSAMVGYMGICLASPLAWLGAVTLLIPIYLHETRKAPAAVPPLPKVP